MIELDDDGMVTPMEFPRVGRRHSWFGKPEMCGYGAFLVLATIVFFVAKPNAIPSLINRMQVIDARIENAVEAPDGMVSLYLVRDKLRNGEPLDVNFFVENTLTSGSINDRAPVLPFRGNENCTKEIGGDDPIHRYNHPTGDHWYTHLCFRLLAHVDPKQFYTLSGELTHYAWPYITPIVHTIKPFVPNKVDAITYPYSVPFKDLLKPMKLKRNT